MDPSETEDTVIAALVRQCDEGMQDAGSDPDWIVGSNAAQEIIRLAKQCEEDMILTLANIGEYLEAETEEPKRISAARRDRWAEIIYLISPPSQTYALPMDSYVAETFISEAKMCYRFCVFWKEKFSAGKNQEGA